MSISNVFIYTVNDGISQTPFSDTITNGGQIVVDTSISLDSGRSNLPLELNVDFEKTKLKSIAIWSDKALVLLTNDKDDADDTITLTPNLPYLWSVNGYFANPFAGDVTTLWVSNTTSGAGTLHIRGIIDPAT